MLAARGLQDAATKEGEEVSGAPEVPILRGAVRSRFLRFLTPNFHTLSTARALPVGSLTPLAPPITVASYTVPECSLRLGSRMAFLRAASYLTMAATLVAVSFLTRVKVALSTVLGSIASEKTATTLRPAATSVTPLAGFTLFTLGGTVSLTVTVTVAGSLRRSRRLPCR